MRTNADIYTRIVDWFDVKKQGQVLSGSVAFIAPFGAMAFGLTGGLFFSYGTIRAFEAVGISLPILIRIAIIGPSTIGGALYCGIRGWKLGVRMVERIEKEFSPLSVSHRRRTQVLTE